MATTVRVRTWCSILLIGGWRGVGSFTHPVASRQLLVHLQLSAFVWCECVRVVESVCLRVCMSVGWSLCVLVKWFLHSCQEARRRVSVPNH